MAALRALGAREDEGGFPALAAAAAPGREASVRGPAMLSLARLGRSEKLRDQARELLLGWLPDPDFSARMDAASALGELGDPKALPALSAMGAVSRLGQTREARPDSRAVLERLAEMERQNAQLRQKIEELAKAVEALKPGPPPEGGKPAEKK